MSGSRASASGALRSCRAVSSSGWRSRGRSRRPRGMLLDEPLTSLDTETAGDMRGMLQPQLAATRTTAVFVTHDAVDAVAVASRLVLIEDGRVTQAGGSARFSPPGDTVHCGRRRAESRRRDPRTRGVGLACRRTGAAPPGRATASVSCAVFRPSAVGVIDRPPRAAGEWTARIVRLEQTPAGVRVHTAEPEVAVDVAADRAARLAPGDTIALRVDPADGDCRRAVSLAHTQGVWFSPDRACRLLRDLIGRAVTGIRPFRPATSRLSPRSA